MALTSASSRFFPPSFLPSFSPSDPTGSRAPPTGSLFDGAAQRWPGKSAYAASGPADEITYGGWCEEQTVAAASGCFWASGGDTTDILRHDATRRDRPGWASLNSREQLRVAIESARAIESRIECRTRRLKLKRGITHFVHTLTSSLHLFVPEGKCIAWGKAEGSVVPVSVVPSLRVSTRDIASSCAPAAALPQLPGHLRTRTLCTLPTQHPGPGKTPSGARPLGVTLTRPCRPQSSRVKRYRARAWEGKSKGGFWILVPSAEVGLPFPSTAVRLLGPCPSVHRASPAPLASASGNAISVAPLTLTHHMARGIRCRVGAPTPPRQITREA
ncbi:hypothetical protein MIND_00401200 [Mycena indigotica]|uniref:Uncharacterized protein n=1 Tax=Mycena indigotica TaxID=2126181 RepID=A0A8H6T5E3_9AGAR|nr:uncharacterized protein MIND_00401200 [Mycena indigotica]KAF7310272.1 hypothetical protein MIND_00401200 [Mycena indigotica]